MELDDAALQQAGWTITQHTRKTGNLAGGTYQTWLPPRGRKALRSRVEVRRHLEAQERATPNVGDRVVLKLDKVEGVVRACSRPGWFMVDLDGYDSSIEFEASELRVLSPTDANDSDDSDDLPITEVFGNAPRDAGRFDQFAFREASAPPRSPRPEAVPESVGAMRSLISSAGLSSADCVEKSELRARSVLALERLAEAKRLRDSRSNE